MTSHRWVEQPGYDPSPPRNLAALVAGERSKRFIGASEVPGDNGLSCLRLSFLVRDNEGARVKIARKLNSLVVIVVCLCPRLSGQSRITFNHGVEGSSPSALTNPINYLAIFHPPRDHRCVCAVPATSCAAAAGCHGEFDQSALRYWPPFSSGSGRRCDTSSHA